MFKTTCLVTLAITIGMTVACVRSEQPLQRELSTVKIEYPIELIGPTVDWRPQDYTDSQGAKAVVFDEKAKCLVVYCDLKGKDEHNSRGEILLDLSFVPTLAGPVDMRNRVITVVVEIPEEFVGWGTNSGQILLKDDQWRSAYGAWFNCRKSGTVALTLDTSSSALWSVADSGLDLSRTRILGIKFAMNDESTHSFHGTIRVKKIAVTPPLPFGLPPELPPVGACPQLATDASISVSKDGFYVGGTRVFVVGGNWRVLEYGQTLGAVREWSANGVGVSKYPGFVAAKMQDFRRAGITLLRVGLLDDGRAVLDKTGRVVGYDDVFRQDVRTFLDLAARFNLRVEFALLDYLVAGPGQDVNGAWIQGRRSVIEDPNVRSAFVSEFLVPFLREFGDHPALLAVDLLNEGEWLISQQEGGGWETVEDQSWRATKPIPLQAFRDYATACTEAIRREAPGLKVTVGASCKFIHLTKGLDTDWYAPHHYDWMGSLGENLAVIPKDRPFVLEEFPGKQSLTQYFQHTQEAGAAGLLLWNLSPEVDNECYRFEEEEAKLQEIRRFAIEP